MVTTEEPEVKLYQGLGCVSIGVAVSALVVQPVLAETIIRAIRLSPTSTGIELIFATQGNNRPPVLTTSRDQSTTADLADTQLRLPATPEDPLGERTSFRQDNPAPGIASVVVSQLNARSVRVTVSSTNNEPLEQVVRQGSTSLVLSFNRVSTSRPPSRSTVRESTNEVDERQESRSTEATTSSGDEPAPAALPVPSQPSRTDKTRPATPPVQSQPRTAQPQPSAPAPAQLPRVRENSPAPVSQPSPASQPRNPAVPSLLPRAVAPPIGDIAIATVDITPREDEEEGRIVMRTLRLNQLRATSQVTLAQRLTSRAETGGTVGGRTPASFDEFDSSNSFSSGGSTTAQTAIGRTTTTSETVRYQGAKEILQAFGANTSGTSSDTSTDETFEDEANPDETLEDETNPDSVLEDETNTDGTFSDGTNADGAFSDGVESSATLLRGLEIVAEARTNTVTLIGSPRLVEIGTAILSQFDVRRRQAAINVKIVDVDLTKGRNSNADLQFRATNTLGFGFRTDPSGTGRSGFSGLLGQGIIGSTLNPTPGITSLAGNFLAFLFASIEDQSAKILTNPTLVVQEGSSAQVNLTQEVFSGFESTDIFDDNTNRLRRRPIIRPAGVIVNVTVENIDDNGFVSLSISPEVSAPSGSYQSDDGSTGILLAQRRLETGSVRLRDGQTLILTGIIQDQDRVRVSKVPILGDIPLLGRLFRREEKTSERREVVVAVTPQILNDSNESTSGYEYRPSPESQKLLNP